MFFFFKEHVFLNIYFSTPQAAYKQVVKHATMATKAGLALVFILMVKA